MNEQLSKYNAAFQSVFNADEDALPQLVYKQTPEWNSMAHIALISALEDSLDICFEAEDIFAFTSYTEGKKLLNERFGIVL